MYTYKWVKVVGIRNDTLQWGANGQSNFKTVEVIEQIGWWMNRFIIKMYPNSVPYSNLQIGDKLCIITNKHREEELVRSKLIEECPTCSAYYFISKHECPAQNDSIRIFGEGEIQAVDYMTGSKTKLLIDYMNTTFTFDCLLPNVHEYKVGDKVKLEGWFRKNTNEFMVSVNK